MANIANFEVNGVSYSYDTESRNPLSNKVKAKAFEGKLVYDANTKAPTEVVGIPANSLKENVGSEPSEPSEAEKPVHTATLWVGEYCCVFPVEITYTGSLNNVKNLTVKGTRTYNCESYSFSSMEVALDADSIDWNDANNAITDGYDDEGFEIVSFDNSEKSAGDYTFTVDIITFDIK